MPRDTVSADSKQYRTRKDSSDWRPGTEGESIGSQQDLNELSYLYGSTVDGGSNDMGATPRSPFASINPETDWERNWRARNKLRRHTVEQGSSTFSWPQKA